MAEESAIGKLDEDQTSFYKEGLCSEADKIYRFALMATLNKDAARCCVTDTYRTVARDLTDRSKHAEPLVALLTIAWQILQDQYGSCEFRLDGQFPKAMHQIDRFPRMALIATDGLGLSEGDACRVFGYSPSDYRQHLGDGRRTMLTLAKR